MRIVEREGSLGVIPETIPEKQYLENLFDVEDDNTRIVYITKISTLKLAGVGLENVSFEYPRYYISVMLGDEQIEN